MGKILTDRFGDYIYDMLRIHHRLKELPQELLIGFAQVMLQPSHVVGAAFLIGAFWNSWPMTLLGVSGCVASTTTALVLNFPKEERRDGLYGFNGALVGLGCAYFYAPNFQLAVFVLLGGIASTLVMRVMLRLRLKPFTFPFVVVTWTIFAFLNATDWITRTSFPTPNQTAILLPEALLRGVGQVLFQESAITGLIFVIAILVRNRIEGLFVLLAASLGVLVGYLFDFPEDAINLGLFGYNGVLCAILFAGRKMHNLIAALAAILLSIAVVRLFHKAELPAFTFPFVLSSWIILWVREQLAPNRHAAKADLE